MVHEHVIGILIGIASVTVISGIIGAYLLETYCGFGVMELIGIAVGLYILFPVLFYWLPFLQRHLIFMNLFQWSFGKNYFEPVRHNISGGRNFYLMPATGVKIGVWQILPKSLVNQSRPEGDIEWESALVKNKRPIVIYFHGNMGNRTTGHRLDLYRLLQAEDFHVIAFDYRGFGNSTTTIPPTESGLVTDSRCVYEWVLQAVGTESGLKSRIPIYLWAHSLGTAVSIHLTSDLCLERALPTPAGIILEAPFTNMADTALSSILSVIYRPLPSRKYLLTSKFKVNDLAFESDRHITEISVPVLILHAKRDMIVPFKLGEKLYDIALKSRPNDSEKIIFKGFDSLGRSSAHVLIWQEPNLLDILTNFVSLCSPVATNKD